MVNTNCSHLLINGNDPDGSIRLELSCTNPAIEGSDLNLVIINPSGTDGINIQSKEIIRFSMGSPFFLVSVTQSHFIGANGMICPGQTTERIDHCSQHVGIDGEITRLHFDALPDPDTVGFDNGNVIATIYKNGEATPLTCVASFGGSCDVNVSVSVSDIDRIALFVETDSLEGVSTLPKGFVEINSIP